jgi:hypothetical protein
MISSACEYSAAAEHLRGARRLAASDGGGTRPRGAAAIGGGGMAHFLGRSMMAADGVAWLPTVPPPTLAAGLAATVHGGMLPRVAWGPCRHVQGGPFWQFRS